VVAVNGANRNRGGVVSGSKFVSVSVSVSVSEKSSGG
jgi:hypothetical protein